MIRYSETPTGASHVLDSVPFHYSFFLYICSQSANQPQVNPPHVAAFPDLPLTLQGAHFGGPHSQSGILLRSGNLCLRLGGYSAYRGHQCTTALFGSGFTASSLDQSGVPSGIPYV